MNNKRSHTFDKYRDGVQATTKEYVREALKILTHSNFDNITDLSKSAANIVYELKMKDYNLSLAKNPNLILAKPKKTANTTLLRNCQYRLLLEVFMSSVSADEPKEPSTSEVEELKIRIASIEAENEILKNKLTAPHRADEPVQQFELSSEDQLHLRKLERNQILLVRMIDDMFSSAHDLFETRDDGFYSYTGERILDNDELKQWLEISEVFRKKSHG